MGGLDRPGHVHLGQRRQVLAPVGHDLRPADRMGQARRALPRRQGRQGQGQPGRRPHMERGRLDRRRPEGADVQRQGRPLRVRRRRRDQALFRRRQDLDRGGETGLRPRLGVDGLRARRDRA